MKEAFPGYYQLSQGEISALWNECTFVLDTSVLLNLYRYPPAARDELFAVLEAARRRLWIPHHVGLEFQRNRPVVIAEQIRRFGDVRSIVEKNVKALRSEMADLQLERRHSSIDPAPLIEKLEGAVNEFVSSLRQLEDGQSDVHQEDRIRSRLDRLLEGSVGSPFGNQEELDRIFADGFARYQRRTPPGYLDLPKERGTESPEFEYGGLVYQRQFGDLIIWEQLISQAKAQSWDKVVFVTDDEKEDWWWIVRSLGDRRLGPRPELVAEITRRADVQDFHLYTSERFLQLSSTYLNVQVSEESISQVEDIRRAGSSRFARRRKAAVEAEGAVALWLKETMSGADVSLEAERDALADIRVTFEGESWRDVIGYQVVHTPDWRMLGLRLRDRLARAFYEISKGTYDSFFFIIALDDPEQLQKTIEVVDDRFDIPPGVAVVVGLLESTDNGPFPRFTPQHEAASDEDSEGS